MDTVAIWPADDRADLFRETANRRAFSFAIAEKDFWVCWTLKHLFTLPNLSEHLIFKGGTTLSKVFSLIERFSEDVDLAIDRHWLGFTDDRDPLQAQGTNRQKDLIEELRAACAEYVETDLKTQVAKRFSEILGPAEDNNWRIEVETTSDDSRNLLFYYPPSDSSYIHSAYIKPSVKMEIGARSDQWPCEDKVVSAYAAQEFPRAFREADCHVMVLAAERTLWEKATLLHAEHHRTQDKASPERLSRHYYDLYRLASEPSVVETAIEKLSLLDDVSRHKTVFFKSAWAKYDQACSGKLRLVPPDSRLPSIAADYSRMKEMIFGEVPSLEEIMKVLQDLERRVNQLKQAAH